MSDSESRSAGRSSFDQLRKQAKELLAAYRSADPSAIARFAAANPRSSGDSKPRPVSLVDAQFVLAREEGFPSWAALKRHLNHLPAYRERYQKLVDDLVLGRNGDEGALGRLRELFGGNVTPDGIQNHLRLRLGPLSTDGLTIQEAQLFVAKLFGFDSWESFRAGLEARPSAPIHGLSRTPPFYKIDWKSNSIHPLPPVLDHGWDEIFEVMRDKGISELNARGQMTDAALERLARLDIVTSLHLEDSKQLTDAGLRHLPAMSRLRQLELSRCSVTDKGLAVLRHLPNLTDFRLIHHYGITDEGLAGLAFCEQIERVELMGSPVGDGVIRTLAGKASLRHLNSGERVTDAGLALLHQFPVFKTWQGKEPRMSLMGFDAEPNYLFLRGNLTDDGLANLKGLDGLFALNLDDSRFNFSVDGVRSLASLPNLGWLGLDATDETMIAVGELPHLRMLMCQDNRSNDAGFVALSRSRTLEYIWGRRCYGLGSEGFKALSRLPALRGLSVSCKNVDDDALAALPDFPALTELMPMDVPDEGFRHVGKCSRLEGVWCMYCRDTGDIATEHMAGLSNLMTYYAGQTLITDRSLEILSGLHALEQLTFSACQGVTDKGVAALATLPRLRELSFSIMPHVTRRAVEALPSNIRVRYET